MLLAAAVSILSTVGPIPPVTWHDNQHPAGHLEAGALHLDLDIVRGDWRPNGTDRAGASILAFAERGQGPTTPGPLLRVRAGTPVLVSVRNTSSDTIAMHGLAPKFGLAARDSVVVPPGMTRKWRFTPEVEGSYFYWGAHPGTPFDDAGIRRRNARRGDGGRSGQRTDRA